MKKYIFALISTILACSIFASELYEGKPKRLSVVRKANGVPVKINYDESKADVLKKLDTLDKIGGGGKISTAIEWLDCERPKVIKFLEEEYFGKMPPRPEKLEFKLVESSDDALDGTAKRRQYKIISTDKLGTFAFDVLVYIPKNAKNPVPAFINANYSGNHSVAAEPQIIMPDCWLRNAESWKISDNAAHEEQRGAAAVRHPMKEIVARGYAVATFCYCAVYPDKDEENEDGAPDSIYKIFDKSVIDKYPRSIPAWAWGNCRTLDLLETIPEIDAKKVGVVGHSRIGKTALLTGAYDTRFAFAVSNSSCCGGAATNRRDYGEKLAFAARRFVYWYQPALLKYADDVESMPIDQQHFIACMAPRPVYVASGTKDFWADPKGELFSLVEASKIYKLFGAKNLPTMDALRVKTPFNGDVGFVLYDGTHTIDAYNWACFMDFTDRLGWKN